jgi:hypothetical protein
MENYTPMVWDIRWWEDLDLNENLILTILALFVKINFELI